MAIDKHWRRQTGFTMIEALVALLVLSIGLLGLGMLQAQGMKFNTDSYLRTQATFLAYEITDRIRANPNGSYQVPTHSAANTKISAYESCLGSAPSYGGACDCARTTCSTANLAIYDLGKWYKDQQRLLPVNADSFSTIEKSGNQYTITIRWMERELPISQAWVVEL